MKKTLVALAALAAVGAYAQTTVVIDGYFDRGYRNVNNTLNTSDLTTVSSNAGTTTVGIKVRENLGGGLSVGGSVNTDWSDIGGASQSNGVAAAQSAGFANSQSFVDVTGNFGVIRLGAVNNYTLTNATAVATPAFSTGVGSSYSDPFSIANGMGTGTSGYGATVVEQAAITNTANVGARAIRIANTVQYSSPSFNGVTAHIGITPQNNNKTAAGGQSNTVGVTEYALRYTAGPIDAMYTSIKYEVGSNGTRQSYMGATGAIATRDITETTNTQNLLGATYTTGAWDILAQVASVDDQSTTDVDRKMTGLGVNYNFSKTARAYVRFDDINFGDNKTAADGSKQTRTAVGVSKSF